MKQYIVKLISYMCNNIMMLHSVTSTNSNIKLSYCTMGGNIKEKSVRTFGM